MQKSVFLLFFLYAATVQTTHAQCDCEQGKGIVTNPLNPINCEDSVHKNTFEWRLDQNIQGPQYLIAQASSNSPVQIYNPFYGPTDAAYFSVLTGGLGFNANDYEPADGWEILKVQMGEDNPDPDSAIYPRIPYFILYNKFTGTLRFFGSLMNPNTTFKTVEIVLRLPEYYTDLVTNNPDFTKYHSLQATNLLSNQGNTLQPLDEETIETERKVYVQYTNNEHVFFWFDLQVAYDPCLCFIRSQLDIDFRFMKEFDTGITGLYPETRITLATPGSNWTGLQLGKIDREYSGKVHPAYPTYNERLGTFAFLETPDIEFFQDDLSVKVKTPSAFGSNSIKEMTLEHYFSFRIGSDLRYALNPLMKLDQAQSKISIRLVIAEDFGTPLRKRGANIPEDVFWSAPIGQVESPLNWEYHPDSVYPYRTPFIPVDQIRSANFRLDLPELPENLQEKMFIQVHIEGVSESKGYLGYPVINDLFFTYPVKMTERNMDFIPGSGNHNVIPGDHHFSEDVLFDTPTVLAYRGIVTISGKMRSVAGVKTKLYAGGGFVLSPGADLGQDIELIVGYPFPKIAQPETDYHAIRTFCDTGGKTPYKAYIFNNHHLAGEDPYPPDPGAELFVKIYPNPNQGIFKMEIYGLNAPAEAGLFTATGAEVSRRMIMPGQTLIEWNEPGLASGIYFLKVTSEQGNASRLITVVH